MPRPRSFDETSALDAALDCFWGRGFEATSIRDLGAAMGISGPSLYNAFGDKRGLFAAALEHYCRTRTYPLIARMEAAMPVAAALPAFFAEIIERSVADRQRRGCFLINSALETAPHEKSVASTVRAHLGAVRAFFVRGLKASAAARGTRRADDVEGHADHLLAVLLGIRVIARTRPERELLGRTARAALLSVGFTPSELRVLGVGAKPRRPTKLGTKRSSTRD